MSTNFDPNIHIAVRRIDEILATNILTIHDRNPLQESAFIEVIIRLNEILYKADSVGSRISLTDDLRLFPHITDITDAIREYRDAVCHIHANGHFIAPDGSPKQPRQRLPAGQAFSQITFNVAFGKGILIQTSAFTIQSEYDDDVCFFYGAHRLYLRRHIIRAFEEAKAVLHSYLTF